MNYGVIFKRTIRHEEDYPHMGHGSYTEDLMEFKGFEDKESLVTWLHNNEHLKEDLKVYGLEELKVVTTIVKVVSKAE